MPERGDDGMYTSSDGTKYVHEAEADRRNTDLADGSIRLGTPAGYTGGSSGNAYLDVAQSADGQAMGGVLGYIGVALIVLILPMYYIPNFIVRVLEDFGHTVNFWLIFFAIWVPILSLIIWVLVKSHITVRILLSIALMSLLATVGVFQWIKLFGGGKDIPYDWYLQKFEAQLADPVRAAKIPRQIAIVSQDNIFWTVPKDGEKIADIQAGTFVTLTNKRSGYLKSIEYNGVEGWFASEYLKKVNSDYNVKLNRALIYQDEPKDSANRIGTVPKNGIITLTDEVVISEGNSYIKVIYNGNAVWFHTNVLYYLVYIDRNNTKQPSAEKMLFEQRIGEALVDNTMSGTLFNDFIKRVRKNNHHVMYNIGMMYYEGREMRQDKEKAFYWIGLAADKGNEDAGKKRNDLFREASNAYHDNDIARAFELWSESAAMGNTNAQFNIGNFYYSGEFVQQDYTKAIEWWTRAAEKGNATAMIWVGICYRDGEGVPQDFDKAEELFKRAIKNGNDSTKESAREELQELNEMRGK